MKISRIVARGFRGFTLERSFDCDADVVLVIGPNGTGKTSFFDAVTWALFGEIRRLRGSRDAVRDGYIESKFDDAPATSVDLYLTGAQGGALVTRSAAGVRVITELEEVLESKSAQSWIDNVVLANRRSSEGAEQMFLRTTLLGQEEMASFLRTNSPRERFDSLSSLLGVDGVREFYAYVGRLAKSMSEQVRTAEVELSRVQLRVEGLRVQLADQEARAEQIGEATRTKLVATLKRLSGDASHLGADVVSVGAQASAIDIRDAAADLESQIRALQDQGAARLNAIQDLIAQQPAVTEAVDRADQSADLRSQLDQQVAVLLKEQEQTQSEQSRLLLARQQLDQGSLHAQRANEELVAFLLSGERHIVGDVCPLCQQPIEEADLRSNIRERTKAVPGDIEETARERVKVDEAEVALADRLASITESMGVISQRIAVIEQERRAANQLQTRWLNRARRVVSTGTPPTTQTLQNAIDEEIRRGARLAELQPKASVVARQTATLAAVDEVVETREREQSASQAASEAAARANALRRWESTIAAFGASARKAETELVEELLASQQPIIRSLYQRLRPHPVFTEIGVEFNLLGDNRGEAYFMASSPWGHGNVSTIYSTAQVSAVAICVFVALNLAKPDEGLNVMMMDDPVQSMDDYNILGLVDLLRLAGGNRQLFVATHDDQIGALMRRKLRPRSQGSRTIVHRYTDFTADGPTVMTVIDEFQRADAVFKSRDVGSRIAPAQ